MDDDKKPVPKGRGSLLLQMMKEKTQAERAARAEALHHSLETPSFSSTDPTKSFETCSPQSSFTSSASVSRGRGQLTSMIKSMSMSSGSESRGPPQAMGRGSLLGLTKRPE